MLNKIDPIIENLIRGDQSSERQDHEPERPLLTLKAMIFKSSQAAVYWAFIVDRGWTISDYLEHAATVKMPPEWEKHRLTKFDIDMRPDYITARERFIKLGDTYTVCLDVDELRINELRRNYLLTKKEAKIWCPLCRGNYETISVGLQDDPISGPVTYYRHAICPCGIGSGKKTERAGKK